MAPQDSKSWDDHRMFVVRKLESLERSIDAINRGQRKILVEVTTLKTKAAGWGLLGGAIPVVILLAVEVLTK